MRNIVKVIIITLSIVLFTSCYDRDVVDYKEFDHSIPKIESLNYTKEGNIVKLSWQIPTNISDDFKRPLEVSIQVVENNIYRQKIIVGNEGTSANVPIDINKEYRFVVKLLGHLTEEAAEEGKTVRVYSAGQTVEIQ